MAAHLSVVPGHEPGAAAPNETTKRPWEAAAGDVIVRDPDDLGKHVEWTITGKSHGDGWFTYLTYSLPGGGDDVAVFEPGQYVTLRTGRGATGDARIEARRGLSCGDRYYIVGRLCADYPEVFDQLLKRLREPLRITAKPTSQEAGTK
jgi:hypothetical protein